MRRQEVSSVFGKVVVNMTPLPKDEYVVIIRRPLYLKTLFERVESSLETASTALGEASSLIQELSRDLNDGDK